jgi:PTH1 family peptidyl-tRNA hydrolase
MFLLVGLGNPGVKYRNNRHNVGHLFVDYMVNELTSLRVNEFKLVKTDCFMNQSGIFVKKLVSKFAIRNSLINNLIIIHDDLDIPLGKFHLQLGVGPQLHNGLESIEQHLRTKDFWRVRIGVDARKPATWVDGESYVLQNFLPEEEKLLQAETFPKILSQLKFLLIQKKMI